ncbi:MAG: hypothetical protein KGL64_07600 [Acidobacteriota bacterium]|nr:hypothetical protein [Acidobacteriota bacterium]
MATAVLHFPFPHNWQAEVLAARPAILPARHFVYPREAEEVERGALEVMVRPGDGAQPFLATCALGFRDPAAPTGLWSTPNPDELCAISGGYAYMVDTRVPERFTMISYRPVLQVLSAVAQGLMLFVGHHSILAWGAQGQAWESAKLSDEGITIRGFANGQLHGLGWEMVADREMPFTLDLRTGRRAAGTAGALP